MWRKQLRVLVQDEVIEDVCCAGHFLIFAHPGDFKCLLRVNKATLDKQLLKLEHVVPKILVLLQKGVLVLSFFQLKVLVTKGGDGCLLLFLKTL